jgi:membrane-associated protease RseP (regulator of RpoE activity)
VVAVVVVVMVIVIVVVVTGHSLGSLSVSRICGSNNAS